MISFTLQQINRVINATWAVGDEELAMKRRLRKGTRSALNVFFLQTVPGGLGIATFPSELQYPDGLDLDGCMVELSTIPGGSKIGYNQGKTVVHEVGHWLGLLHTFEGGCEGEGDLIADTPASRGPSGGCPVGRDSCPDQAGLDPIHNFMDFSYE